MKPCSRGFLRLAIAAGLVAATGAAFAVKRADHLPLQAEFAMADGSSALVGKDLGTTTPAARVAAWDRFQKAMGPGWRGYWDPARGTASQLFGPGLAAPGSVADARRAANGARALLAAHIDLFAPGSNAADYVLVANQLNPAGDMRVVGFEQRAHGMPVLGGGMTVAFKNDRLFFITVDSYPFVDAKPAPAAAPAVLTERARDYIAAELALAPNLRAASNLRAGAPHGPYVLPVASGPALHKPARVSYYTVYAVPVETAIPVGGGWDVYIDPRNSRVIGQRRTTLWADATVGFELGKRQPAKNLQTVVASFTNTSAGRTDGAGVVDAQNGQSITLETSGPLVQMNDNAGANVRSASVDASTSQAVGAPVSQTNIPALANFTTFAYLNLTKQYVRERMNPNLGWLDQSLYATVNIGQSCNAYYNGTVNMFSASSSCQNTGALADVVIHEFGHGLHGESLIGGVPFNGAISEAHGDILAMTIADAPNMGEGWWHSNPDRGLRELDPPDRELRWPDDRTGEVHDDGEIYGGAMWDLRKSLVAVKGYEPGVALFERLWYASVQHAASIPDSYGAILAEDDDDGDLTNGTPTICLINAALDPHGLVPGGSDLATTPSLGTPVIEGLGVAVPVTRPDSGGGACEVAAIASATLRWNRRGEPDSGGELAMTESGDVLGAVLPAQADGTVVEYRIEVTFSDGSTTARPANPADPWYQLYVGRTKVLYCADFDSATDDWRFGGTAGAWEIGAPAGAGDDPGAAWSGDGVLANNLTGAYDRDSDSWAEVTVAGLAGHDAVRLQYRRWLNVEDGYYDRATISIDGEQAWANLDSQAGQASDTHHTDGEWRFHDLDITDAARDGEVSIRFALETDQGLQLGGWTVDDVCVVAHVAPACGDGYLDAGEVCDDGNTDDGDGCSATCTAEDGGGDGDGDGDGDGSGADADMSGGCGCQGGGGAPAGGLALVLGCAALVSRRRRRAPRG